MKNKKMVFKVSVDDTTKGNIGVMVEMLEAGDELLKYAFASFIQYINEEEYISNLWEEAKGLVKGMVNQEGYYRLSSVNSMF